MSNPQYIQVIPVSEVKAEMQRMFDAHNERISKMVEYAHLPDTISYKEAGKILGKKDWRTVKRMCDQGILERNDHGVVKKSVFKVMGK